MNIGGIDFKPAVGASGVQGFFGGDAGIEYPHHRFYKHVPGFTFDGMTFCAKTTTFNPNKGNTELAENRIALERMFPNSVYVDFGNNFVLNAVGLSGPGAEFLMSQGHWQRRREPFMLSFMAIGNDSVAQEFQTVGFANLIRKYTFLNKFAIQLNVSCPNTGHDTTETAKAAKPLLDVLEQLDVPILVKINLLTSVEDAKAIEDHPACAGLVCFNTLPFANIPDYKKRRFFQAGEPGKSPIPYPGGGGLSGQPIFSMTYDWLRRAESAGFKKPIIAGGGVTSVRDVDMLAELNCVKGISLGSVAITRPWRMKKLIQTINQHPRLA